MIQECLQKRVMNGSVVPMIEKPRHDEIKAKTDQWREVFYNGEKLSLFEQDLERQYIAEKQVKNQKFSQTKSMRHKVHWTISDLNRYQE